MNIEQLNKIRQIKVELSSAKVNDISANDFADYPWSQCVADQTKAYGSKSIAEAVCGKIKSENQSKVKDPAEQEFKIPTPTAGEKPDDYIARCMMAIGSEYDTQEQSLAVCYSQIEKK